MNKLIIVIILCIIGMPCLMVLVVGWHESVEYQRAYDLGKKCKTLNLPVESNPYHDNRGEIWLRGYIDE